MKDERRKPIEERIAELFGKGARDPREAFGGTGMVITTDDIARALGNIAIDNGTLIPLLLETKYGSTLMHERDLCRAWETFAKKEDPTMDKETVTFSRIACTFAIRELATGKKAKSEIVTHFAWLAGVRRVSLEAAIWIVGSWFDELVQVGERALKKQFKEVA